MDREEALRLIGEDISHRVREAAEEVGDSVNDDARGLAIYAAERADYLSRAMGEPGFDQALIAERDNIALASAGSAVSRADNIDERVLALTKGMLAMAARALVIIAV